MILVAVGANLPLRAGLLPLETCKAAVDRIANIGPLKLVAVSRWYRTAAISDIPQPDYCNGIVRLEGEIAPAVLLARLQQIETQFGRVRSLQNAPRTLDLDIIDLNGALLDEPSIILPHPRAHIRAFVLRPILDVAPHWSHPIAGRKATDLLEALPPQGVGLWQD